MNINWKREKVEKKRKLEALEAFQINKKKRNTTGLQFNKKIIKKEKEI